jgi:hypothetical protein
VEGSRFKYCTQGDVSVLGVRARFLGNDSNHPYTSIKTGGSQVEVIGVANRFVANPQLGTLSVSRGFYMANVGNTNDALLAPSFTVQAGLVQDVSGSTSNAQLTVRADTANGAGANLRLEGDGATTPMKHLRAHSGHLQLMNHAYSSVIFDVDDTGLASLPALRVNGTDDVSTAWTSQAGAVSTSGGSGLTATGVVRTKKVGRVVSVQIKVTVSSLGTGSGAVVVVLPYAAAADAFIGGKETGVSAKALAGNINATGSTVAIVLYDGTYPITSVSSVLLLEGSYETST